MSALTTYTWCDTQIHEHWWLWMLGDSGHQSIVKSHHTCLQGCEDTSVHCPLNSAVLGLLPIPSNIKSSECTMGIGSYPVGSLDVSLCMLIACKCPIGWNPSCEGQDYDNGISDWYLEDVIHAISYKNRRLVTTAVSQSPIKAEMRKLADCYWLAECIYLMLSLQIWEELVGWLRWQFIHL